MLFVNEQLIKEVKLSEEFAIHKATEKTLQQLRKEYMDQHPEVL